VSGPSEMEDGVGCEWPLPLQVLVGMLALLALTAILFTVCLTAWTDDLADRDGIEYINQMRARRAGGK